MAKISKFERKDGTIMYRTNVYLGIDEKTGKRKTTTISKSSRKELDLAVAKLKLDVEESGFSQNSKKLRFKDIYKLWLEQYQHNVKESTLNKTMEIFENHILPTFEDVYIEKIDVFLVQKSVNEWYKSLTKFKVIKNYLSTVMDYAISLQIIERNPCKWVNIPKKKKSTSFSEEDSENFWSKEELEQFLKQLEKETNPMVLPLFRVLAFTGMRKGELLALTWSDINFKDANIRINKTLTRGLNNVLIIQEPKTTSSARIIPIDDRTLNILSEWNKVQKKDFLKFGFNTLKPKQLVFPNIKNEFLSPTKVGKYMDRIINQCENLQRITPHGLRHTHVSLLFEAGANVKEVQTRLGHADANVTLNIYAHVSKQKKEETANKFANYIAL